MAEAIKETALFGGHRRKLELESWQVLRSKAGEKRLKMEMRMPLSGESLIAMPDWVGNTYEVMIKDGSAPRRGPLDRYLEGMTFEVFPTEKHRSRALSLTGVTIKNLCVDRDGEEDTAEVSLRFVLYSPGNVQGRDWAWDLIGGSFWGTFEYSQTEFEFSGEKAGEDTEDATGDGEELAAAGVVAGARRGRGKAVPAVQ